MDAALPAPTAPRTAPRAWPWALEAAPFACTDTTPWRGALLRAWRGSSPVMAQPPLDHHYVVMHLGGAKRVNRRQDGAAVTTLADCGSLTFVPAGTAYLWRTEGPIAFAHLYLDPQRLARFLAPESDVNIGSLSLVDRVGARDALIEAAFARMLDIVGAGAAGCTLLLDALLESFMVRLAQRHLSARVGGPTQAVALAPHRLRRVLDYIDAHLGADIALADLVDSAGSSQYHFSRAFHRATGTSPYRYLLDRRIELARVLLMTRAREPVESVAAACGFNSARQFGLMFKRGVGVGPKQYQIALRPPKKRTPH